MILNYTDTGDGEPILLLHGMAASLRYWDPYIEDLAATNRVIAIDLMGFGRSPQSSESYTPEAHTAAIQETLESLNILEPVVLIGHSMGALIALKLATLFPSKVSKLILISLPIYLNSGEAKKDITKSKLRLKFTYYGVSSRILCNIWCYRMRPVSKRLAHLYMRKWPKNVAEDSVLHTWRSYSQSLSKIVENQSVEKDLAKLKIPVYLIHGDQDSELILSNARSLNKLPRNIKACTWHGTHNLPLENQSELLSLIR